MIALALAASLQELSRTLDSTPFKAEYTVSREGSDKRFNVGVKYSPPDMARVIWHTPEGDVGVSTDGERFYTIYPEGASSVRMRELSTWMDDVHARLEPRFRALAGALGKPYTREPLGEPGVQLELALSRTGDEKRPFFFGGSINLGWNQD